MAHRRVVGLIALLVVPLGCDTNVSNPGPVEDKFLSDRHSYWIA